MKIFLLMSLIFISLFSISCNSTKADTSAVPMELSQSTETDQERETQLFTDGKVDFQGVSFNYNSQIFEIREESIIHESPMQDETEKPGWNFPKHIAFTLLVKNKLIEPEATIRIIPIADYRRMYAVSKGNTEWFNKYLKDVQMIIKDKNHRTSRNNEVPFLPYMDASQLFNARVKHFPFKSGKGFFFLTQYTQDYGDLVNNESLVYYFQGISTDGKKYILAEFPVNISFLPANSEIAYKQGFEGYRFPENYLADKTNNEKRYNKYITEITKRLENLPQNEFQPNLNELEKIISTLKIEK